MLIQTNRQQKKTCLVCMYSKFDLNRRLLTLFWFTKKFRSPILLLNMGDKIYILIIHADLSCCHCRKKIEKCLRRMQRRERILSIVYDDKNNVVIIDGPFCNPHELKEKLLCKLPKVITCIEIKDPAECDKEKCEKELEKCRKEKEKFEKELEKCKKEREKCNDEKEKCKKELEKCKSERENCEKELEKCKCERWNCAKELVKCKCERWNCEKELQKCKCEKEKCKCEKVKCQPLFIRPVPWPPASTDCCCRPTDPCRPGPCEPCCSSCGPTPPRPCDNQGCNFSNCKAIILEEHPADSCSIM